VTAYRDFVSEDPFDLASLVNQIYATIDEIKNEQFVKCMALNELLNELSSSSCDARMGGIVTNSAKFCQTNGTLLCVQSFH